MAKVIVVGAGTIGKPLVKRLVAEGHEVCLVTRKKPDLGELPPRASVPWAPAPKSIKSNDMEFTLDGFCHNAVAAFLVIPTGADHGTIAMAYMLYFLSKGMLVITAEKGTSAYHFDKMQPHLDSIGCYATVGGGNLFIPSMQQRRLRGQPLLIHGVLNGTLNYIMSGVVDDRALVTVCEEARDLGYAEPAEKVDPESIFKGEINDVRLKMCALYNHVLANPDGPFLTPGQFEGQSTMTIRMQDLLNYTDHNRVMRNVVTIKNVDGSNNGAGGAGSLYAKLGTWTFDARFVDITPTSPLYDFLPSGVDNCIKVLNVATGNGPYRSMGPGAGKIPTVDALITNFNHLYEIRQREP